MFNKQNGAPPLNERHAGSARALLDGRPPAATAAIQPAPPTAKVQAGDFVYPLTEPLQTHAGPVTDLVFKVPKAGFIMRHGLPWSRTVVKSDSGDVSLRVDFNHALMGKFMSEMTGYDEGVLGTMSGRDVFACWNIVMQLTLPLGNSENS